MKKVVWSKEASNDFAQNIEYLQSEWSAASAIVFINDVEAILDLIKDKPKLFPVSNYKSIRRAVIRKQITLFYQEREEAIYLVRFWNNYQNPRSLNL